MLQDMIYVLDEMILEQEAEDINDIIRGVKVA